MFPLFKEGVLWLTKSTDNLSKGWVDFISAPSCLHPVRLLQFAADGTLGNSRFNIIKALWNVLRLDIVPESSDTWMFQVVMKGVYRGYVRYVSKTWHSVSTDIFQAAPVAYHVGTFWNFQSPSDKFLIFDFRFLIWEQEGNCLLVYEDFGWRCLD